MKNEKTAFVILKLIKIYLMYAVLNPIVLSICPKFSKEGGGPNTDQKVLNIFVPNRGRRVGGQPI